MISAAVENGTAQESGFKKAKRKMQECSKSKKPMTTAAWLSQEHTSHRRAPAGGERGGGGGVSDQYRVITFHYLQFLIKESIKSSDDLAFLHS
jgi:hypothetical protein